MKKIIISILSFTLLLGLNNCVLGQTKPETEEATDWVKQIKSKITPYASLRVGFGFAEEGEMGISNNSPRGGLKVKHALSKKESDNFNIIGRVEFGFNLISRDETVEFAVDADAGVAQVGDAVFTRLGFLGFTFKNFQLTFGKQNSIYFTMGAAQVDHFSAFGGSAIGVWNISDGGVSGTGRANQSMILSYKKNGLSIGAQAQARNISANSETIDAFALAASYKISEFAIGIAYNKVNDGVEIPFPNQAKSNDEAFVTSASYEKNRFLIAASYAVLKQHQKVSRDRNTIFYDANGIEFIIRYKFSKNKRWHAAVGYNSLVPDDGQGLEDYTTNFGVAEIAYSFKKSSKIFIATKIDQSKNFIGDRRSQSVFGMGLRLDL